MTAEQVAVACKDTVYHFLPGERRAVSHVELRVENTGASPANLEITRLSFVENDAATPLDSYHVYLEDTETGRQLRVPRASEGTMRIGFAARPVTEARTYAVRIEFLIEGRERTCHCPIRVSVERAAT